jgi:hypothetical protein
MKSDPISELRVNRPEPDTDWASSTEGRRVMERALEHGTTPLPSRGRVAMPSRPAFALVVGAVVAGAVLFYSTTSTGPDDSPNQPLVAGSAPTGATPADRQYLLDNLATRSSGMNARQLARNFAEYLPNQLFIVGGSNAKPAAAGVVRGTVVDAVGARGYYVPGGLDADAPSGTATKFDDARAQWRIIDITIEVQDAVGLDVGDRVHVGVVVDGQDTKALLRGARSLGPVVAILDGQGFFKADPKLFNVAGFGSLLGMVEPDNSIRFETLGSHSNKFVGALTTWQAVRTEYAESKAPITTDTMGNRAGDQG